MKEEKRPSELAAREGLKSVEYTPAFDSTNALAGGVAGQVSKLSCVDMQSEGGR